jgi:hypothetical protein
MQYRITGTLLVAWRKLERGSNKMFALSQGVISSQNALPTQQPFSGQHTV